MQVKTVRYPNAFPMRRENIDRGRIYVFVILNEPDKDEDYFVVPGEDILGDINHFFGTSYIREKPPRFPGVNYGPLKPYRNRWDVFNRKTAEES